MSKIDINDTDYLFLSVPRPNLDSYIFLTVLEEQQKVMVDPE
jgi:hypothetical protein